MITSQAAHRDPPHWWRLALQDAGQAAGAHVLAHDIARDPIHVKGHFDWIALGAHAGRAALLAPNWSSERRC